MTTKGAQIIHQQDPWQADVLLTAMGWSLTTVNSTTKYIIYKLKMIMLGTVALSSRNRSQIRISIKIGLLPSDFTINLWTITNLHKLQVETNCMKKYTVLKRSY